MKIQAEKVGKVKSFLNLFNCIEPKSCIPNTKEMLFYKHTNELMFDKTFYQLTVKVNPKSA